MPINITIIGLDAVDRLLDRLLAEQGQNGGDVEEIERERWTVEAAVENLEEALRKAAGCVPPEDEDMSEAKPEWKPTDGETYWYMDCGEVPQAKRAVWRNGSADHIREILGNVFQSEAGVWKWFSGVRE